tara:strand:- start:326 stop:526 length:201 start_codon:yes stop_codon:yes gene_type:complete
MIDADLAQFIDDDQDVPEVPTLQQLVEQHGFAAAQETSDDRNGDHTSTLAPGNLRPQKDVLANSGV